MPLAGDRTLRALTGWLGIAVLVELVLLRTGTRTIIHIPGLGRFDVSIGVLSELGRLAYYIALVLVVSTLFYLAWSCWVTRSATGRLVGGLVWMFLAVALLGRVGLVPGAAVGWLSLIVMAGVLVVTWSGARSLPVVLFVSASASATWSVLGQGQGGGLSGETVDTAVVLAEALLILAGVTAPLLVKGKVTKSAFAAGLVTVVVVAAGLSVGGSTLAVLTLWNLGVPGWFPPIAYGLALGALIVTLWSALFDRQVPTACAVLSMVGGGVGPISTYQTALALTAVILLGVTGAWASRIGGLFGVQTLDRTTAAENGDLVLLS